MNHHCSKIRHSFFRLLAHFNFLLEVFVHTRRRAKETGVFNRQTDLLRQSLKKLRLLRKETMKTRAHKRKRASKLLVPRYREHRQSPHSANAINLLESGDLLGVLDQPRLLTGDNLLLELLADAL